MLLESSQRKAKLCGTKLKRFSALSALFCLLSFSPLSFSCFAEVKLTDEEIETILNEINESKKELEDVKSELSQSQKDLIEQKTELEDVKSTYNEQKTSYEMQLNEAEKQNKTLKTVSVATGSSTVVLTIAVILLIIF